MISIVACCHGAKLCAYVAWHFPSQQNGAVTRMWRSCRVQPSQKERAISVVRLKRRGCLCNLSGDVVLTVWFTTNGMCAKNKNIYAWCQQAFNKRDCDAWSLLLLAATVRSFAHISLGISDRNKMVLWPGCEGRAEFSLHKKNVRSVWFVSKRRGCCCNLSSGVALIVWFTTNGMCVKNKNIYAWREQAIIREIATHHLYSC